MRINIAIDTYLLKIKSGGNCITSRVPLLFNDDLIISKAHVDCSMDLPYKNGCADEVLFIHEGVGTLHSNFGNINLKAGDYLVIPRGCDLGGTR